MINMLKKLFAVTFLCILVLTCENPLNVTTDVSVPGDMALVRLSLSGKFARSVLPDMPSLDNIVGYDLYGTTDPGREEVWLDGFEDLEDATVLLRPGTWNFTLKAYDDSYYYVLMGVRQGINISVGHTETVQFNLSLINDPDDYGWVYIVIELPPDVDVDWVETTIDGETLDPPLEIDDGIIEYFDELPVGDYLINFVLKDSNDNDLAIITEIIAIRGGLESYKYIELGDGDLNGPPDVPANFRVTAYNSTSGNLTFVWENNSRNETGFVLDDETDEYNINAGLTSYNLNVGVLNINDLEGNSYTLYAVNNYGESDRAEYQIVQPETPTGLDAEPLSSSSIMVSWQTATGAASYIIQRATSSSGAYSQIGTVIGASYTDTSLPAGTTYYYRVISRNILGDSSASSVVSAQTLIPAPTGLSVTVASTTSITVSWNSVTGATGYYVYRSATSGGTYTRVGTATANSYTNTGLSSSTTYYYKVSAYNANGEGELSSYVSGTIVVYTVTYNINGGTGTTPSAQTVIPGSSVTLASGSGLSRSGYAFDGWNTNTSGTGTNYNAGSSYTPTGNITLYAKWIATTTITLNYNEYWEEGSYWQNLYQLNSLLNGSRIMTGNVYIFTYSFRSNVAIDRLQVVLVDASEAANYWGALSNYLWIRENISANTVVSGSVTFTATGTATSAAAIANNLVFQAGEGTASAPTLTFTTFEFRKQ